MAINQQELKLIISQALEGDGMQKAAQELQTLATKADETKVHLTESFKAGETSADTFLQETRKVDTELETHARAVQAATQTTNDHAAAHGTLASKIGASRQQLGGFVQTAGEVVGVDSNVAQGLGAITSGLGPLGLGLAGVTLVVKEYIDWLDKAAKKEIELADIQARPQGYARDQAERRAQEAAATQRLTQESESLARQLAAIESGLASNDSRVRAQAQLYADAAGGVEAMRARLSDMREELHKVKDAFGDQAPAMAPFKDDLDYIQHAAQTSTEAIDGLAGALARNSASLKDTAGAFVEETQAQADAVARQTEMQTKIAGWDKERIAREAAQRKAESEAEQAQRKAATEAARMAEAQTKLSTERIAIEKIAGASAAATFDTIVAHAGDAADAVKLVAMWEATLKPNIKQQIDILVASHLDSFLASLLGGRGPRQSTGNQEGDEWDFTLGGENQSVRFDYERRYGQTAAANEAWQRDHRAELQQQGYTGPGQTPGSSAAAWAAANGFAPSAGGSGGVTNVYQLNLSTQKSQSNVVQDFKSLKSLAGANT